MIENAAILNDQAIKLNQAGSVQEAIACLARAITIDKDNYALYYNLGLTYRDNGNLQEARNMLEKAYDLCDYDDEVVETLAMLCWTLGDFSSALYYCEEGLDCNPNNSHLWNTYGAVLFNQEEFSDAEEAFENAIMINPNYYDALYNLRDAYEETGNKRGVMEISLKLREIEKSGIKI